MARAYNAWTHAELVALKGGRLDFERHSRKSAYIKARTLGVVFDGRKWTKAELAQAEKGRVPKGRTRAAMAKILERKRAADAEGRPLYRGRNP